MRAIVVDKLTTEFILGLNFLNKFKVEIKIKEQCLVINHQQKQTYVKFGKPNSVRLAQQCTILPRCKRVVNATISNIINENNILLKVIDQKTQQFKRIRHCDGLVDIKNNTVQLTIYNPKTKIVTLLKSMCIGTVDH